MEKNHSAMDYSSAIRIQGKGGGGGVAPSWWDFNLPFCVPSNVSFCASPRENIFKFANGFFHTSGKMLLCLMVLILYVPGPVNCGEYINKHPIFSLIGTFI